MHEGPSGLFRGLGPNLVGVAPSRAIYFWSYSSTKQKLNRMLPAPNRDTPFVHVVSAASAGKKGNITTRGGGVKQNNIHRLMLPISLGFFSSHFFIFYPLYLDFYFLMNFFLTLYSFFPFSPFPLLS